jgi:hypothetical protein
MMRHTTEALTVGSGRDEQTSRRRVPALTTPVALVIAAFVAATAGAQVTHETVNVVGQGLAGPLVAMNGATLRRSDSGLTGSLRMPTPVPGSYVYPPGNAFQPLGAFPGHPEAFSLWLFAFNYPEDCLASPCDLADFMAGRGAGGAFNAGGHVVGGPTLQLSGRVTINSEPFAGSPLLEPRTAEVHLAVAPHGALQPDVMPNQIKFPIGTPDHWWLAIFD